MIDYSGLRVCQYRPGRAVVVLMLMRYIDGDLGQYLEYGTSMVNPGDRPLRARALRSRRRVHPPPAGRPGVHARGRLKPGAIRSHGSSPFAKVGRFSSIMSASRAAGGHGIPNLAEVPVPSAFTSHANTSTTSGRRPRGDAGVMAPRSVRTGLAVPVWLDDHPYAKELGRWVCPRALVSSVDTRLQMTFGDAKEEMTRPCQHQTRRHRLHQRPVSSRRTRGAYRWMRATSPVFRDHNGLAAAAL